MLLALPAGRVGVGLGPDKNTASACLWFAQSGKFGNVANIHSQLCKEGYQADQLAGGSLLRQLRKTIKLAASN
jgi:hypothetical protein